MHNTQYTYDICRYYFFTLRGLLTDPYPFIYGMMIKRNEMRHCYAAYNLLNCALSSRMAGQQLFASDVSSPSNDVPIFILQTYMVSFRFDKLSQKKKTSLENTKAIDKTVIL